MNGKVRLKSGRVVSKEDFRLDIDPFTTLEASDLDYAVYAGLVELDRDRLFYFMRTPMVYMKESLMPVISDKRSFFLWGTTF